MIDEKYWIESPVGYNLDDNPNAFVVVSDPNLEIYDYVSAYNTPIAEDAAQYLVVSQLALPLTPFFPAFYMIATNIFL